MIDRHFREPRQHADSGDCSRRIFWPRYSERYLQNKWGDYPLIILAALGMCASFPDMGLWYLVVPSLALFIGVIDRCSTRRAAWLTMLFSFCFFMVHLEWLRVSSGSWVPWFALALIETCIVVVWSFIVSWVRVWKWTHTIWGQCASWSLLWVGIEQLRARIPFGGFPWANISYPQVDAPWGRFAPYGGEVLVSFITFALAVLVRRVFSIMAGQQSSIYQRMRGAGPPVVMAIAIVVLPICIPALFGSESGSVRVAVIQGNVEIPGNQTYAILGKVTGNHVRTTRNFLASGDRSDLILWGEGSAERDPRMWSEIRDEMNQISDEANIPILIGFDQVLTDKRFNWVGFWYPRLGLEFPLYGKQHPVPFGEYIPWRALLNWLLPQSRQVNVDMEAVDNPAFLRVRLNDGRHLPLAMATCFEVAYEGILRQGIALGGEMIVSPSNNYHFQYSAESTQQAQMLRFRALEYSRAAVQVSTTGVSMIAGPDGAIQKMTGKQKSTYLVADIPLRKGPTPIVLVGPLPAYATMVAVVVVGVVSASVNLILKRQNA